MTLEEARRKYPDAETFTFGDDEALCTRLLDLVRDGRKTATCGALRDFVDDGEAMPVPGRLDIVLHWDGTPALVIRTVAVEQRRFGDVDETFALQEGENTSLAGWRAGHRAFFERNGGFDESMMLVCERFERVEILD